MFCMAKQSPTDCRVVYIPHNDRFFVTNVKDKIMKLWPYVLGAWLVLTGLNSVISLNFQYEKWY